MGQAYGRGMLLGATYTTTASICGAWQKPAAAMSYTAGAAQYRELGGISFMKLDVIHLIKYIYNYK